MGKITPIIKDENEETPVPSAWRDSIFSMVETIKDGSFNFCACVPDAATPSQSEMDRALANISSYGQTLICLPEEAWNTSICRWMGDYWLVLVDLFTAEEGASDLVMFLKVFENGSSYRFEMDSVHVP